MTENSFVRACAGNERDLMLVYLVLVGAVESVAAGLSWNWQPVSTCVHYHLALIMRLAVVSQNWRWWLQLVLIEVTNRLTPMVAFVDSQNYGRRKQPVAALVHSRSTLVYILHSRLLKAFMFWLIVSGLALEAGAAYLSNTDPCSTADVHGCLSSLPLVGSCIQCLFGDQASDPMHPFWAVSASKWLSELAVVGWLTVAMAGSISYLFEPDPEENRRWRRMLRRGHRTISSQSWHLPIFFRVYRHSKPANYGHGNK